MNQLLSDPLLKVDKGAAEAGVEGFAGRPLRPRLPHLQAVRRPHGGYGGNHLAEAGKELADLPWSIDIRECQKGFHFKEGSVAIVGL